MACHKEFDIRQFFRSGEPVARAHIAGDQSVKPVLGTKNRETALVSPMPSGGAYNVSTALLNDGQTFGHTYDWNSFFKGETEYVFRIDPSLASGAKRMAETFTRFKASATPFV